MYLVMAKSNYPDNFICDTYETAKLYIRKIYTDCNQGNDFVEYLEAPDDKKEEAWVKYYEKHHYENEIFIMNLDPESFEPRHIVTMTYLFERCL